VRVVLVTGNGLTHRYMANRLLDSGIPLVGIVVDHGKVASPTAKLKRIWRRYTVGQIAGRICLKGLREAWRDDKSRDDQLTRVLGKQNCQEFKRPTLVHSVFGINTDASMRVVSALDPDVLLVFGTGIVGDRITRLARTIALNAHTGLSPHYRGAECAFWPLHNAEPHMLGATVHECTQQIDGGSIFATGKPTLEADDRMHAVYGRCVVVAADLYIRVVRGLLQGGSERWTQNLSVGREYKANMHGLRAELRVRRLVKRGLIRRYVQSTGRNRNNQADTKDPS